MSASSLSAAASVISSGRSSSLESRANSTASNSSTSSSFELQNDQCSPLIDEGATEGLNCSTTTTRKKKQKVGGNVDTSVETRTPAKRLEYSVDNLLDADDDDDDDYNDTLTLTSVDLTSNLSQEKKQQIKVSAAKSNRVVGSCNNLINRSSSSATESSDRIGDYQIKFSTNKAQNSATLKAFFKDPTLMLNNSTTSNNALTCIAPTLDSKTTTTKPLLINHSTSLDQTKEIAIIPSLTSQLIFSSVISSQQSNNNNSNKPSTTSTTTTTTKSKTTLILNGANVKTYSSSSKQKVKNESLDMSSGARKQQASASASCSPSSTAGHAVTARLMDMGKRLLDAAKEGNTDHVRQLVVNAGAPFTSDWLGTTALHLAAQNGHAEVAEILLRGGVNRDARTKLERTALHLAAQCGSLEVVDLLLIHGSDVNARDMLKMTPLHWAVERSHTCVAERLLFGGADVKAKSKFHLTPLDIAQESECSQIVQLFKNWTKGRGEEMSDSYGDLKNNNDNFIDSHDMLDEVDYNLALEDDVSASRASILDIDEPCIDLVELEWNELKFEPDFFLSNAEDDVEPRVEYLMKVVEELQKENRQLRQRVEQLSTASQ